MQEIRVNSTSSLLAELLKFRGDYSPIFRGHKDSSWDLRPKAGREEYAALRSSGSEKRVFGSWKRYAIHYLNVSPTSEIDWLSLAQHHGLATRLLDWTKSALSGVFFAINGNIGTDAAVYVLKTEDSDINLDIEDPFSVRDNYVMPIKG